VKDLLKLLTLRRLRRENTTVSLPLAEIRADCPMTAYQRAYYGQIWQRHREMVPRCLKDLIDGCHRPYLLAGEVEDIQAMHKETLGLIEEPESFAEECGICDPGRWLHSPS
jgi:hypothetical protein